MLFSPTLKSGSATVSQGGKVCQVQDTALCDTPIRRNTGTHTIVIKQTSNLDVRFGAASAGVNRGVPLGDQSESAAVKTTGAVLTGGSTQGSYETVDRRDPFTFVVDTNTAGPLELVVSARGRERKRLPIKEGWHLAVGCANTQATFEIVSYALTGANAQPVGTTAGVDAPVCIDRLRGPALVCTGHQADGPVRVQGRDLRRQRVRYQGWREKR